MNEEHAIIENYGGKTVIASWEPSPLDEERRMIVFQGKDSFLLRYCNRYVTIEVPHPQGGTRWQPFPLGAWWLNHRDRRQYRGIVFRPGKLRDVGECLNIWQGWGVVRKLGDWGLIRSHIEEVIADGNAEYADYIIKWIAWSIQNPDKQAEVALVLIGAKGTGKGTLARCLQKIFGAHAFQVSSRDEVVGRFNGHLQDCILFIADEAYWGGDKRCVGRLQAMITETTLAIEKKGFEIITVPNYLHIIMLAEPGWVIPAGMFERRYAAFEVGTKRRGDRAYFKALHQQMFDEGGAEAMMWDLKEMDLDGWHPREMSDRLLESSALRKQQTKTLPPLEQWYLTLLHEGRIPGALINPDPIKWPKKMSRPSTTYTKRLKDNATERFPRLKWELSDNQLAEFLLDSEWPKAGRFRDSKNNGYTFEPLKESRQEFDKRYGPQGWNEMEEWDPHSKSFLDD